MQSGDDRQRISGQSPYEPVIGFSRAVRCGRFISVSGTGPVNPDGGSAGGDDPALQMASCLEIIREALNSAGARFEHIVRTRIYLTRAADWEPVGRVHGKYFALCRPASTMVIVAALLRPEWRVEVEADAIIPEEG
ncbi:MAG TPA: RidA family protein [Acidisarcina sp.]|nr:RidA family protein [Acidisarcina sp.]